MRAARSCIVWFLILYGSCVAQSDSIVYRPEQKIRDGFYLSYKDFRSNRSIPKEQVQTDLDKTQLEFLSKVLFENEVKFKRNDSVLTMPSQNVWGYFQNNTLYVYFREDFYRVPVFGAISYLVANVLVPSTGFYDSRFGTATASSNREIREFLLDFYDGQIREFSSENFEELIKRDAELFLEYRKLSRKQRRESHYKFIRRFNERHPVYFLQGN